MSAYIKKTQNKTQQFSNAGVPNLFGIGDRFHGRQFSMDRCGGDGFIDATDAA